MVPLNDQFESFGAKRNASKFQSLNGCDGAPQLTLNLIDTMMSKQRYRHLIFMMSALLLPSTKSTLSSRGKVRRTQVVEGNGISLEEIEHNFEPDGDFSVSDAAAALLQFDHGNRAPGTAGRDTTDAPTPTPIPLPPGVYNDSSGWDQKT